MPDRRPYIAGNWKMFKTAAEAREFIAAFAQELGPAGSRAADVGLCVPSTALAASAEAAAGHEILISAQNMHQAEEGAFTGEVSAAMILETGATGVVLGHSERRQLFGETDAALKEKVPAALAARPGPDPLRRRDRGGARGRRHRAPPAPAGAGGPGRCSTTRSCHPW